MGPTERDPPLGTGRRCECQSYKSKQSFTKMQNERFYFCIFLLNQKRLLKFSKKTKIHLTQQRTQPAFSLPGFIISQEYWQPYKIYRPDVHKCESDPPSTVTVARAVRTGMVKMEQVYSPSSDSCTSEMVMESSVGVERCSWMRLSLSAEGSTETG